MPKRAEQTDNELLHTKYFVENCSASSGDTIVKIYEKKTDRLLKIGIGEEYDKPILIFKDYDDYVKWYKETKTKIGNGITTIDA